MFEAFVKQSSPGRSRLSRRLFFVASFALHGGLLLAAVAHSFWHVDELTPSGVTVTFINAMTPPPPPPPPPAAAAKVEKAQPKVKRPRPEPVEIVQPTPEEKPLPEEKPEAPAEETAVAESEGPAAPQGEAGGVEGGIAGGVLGRIAPAPPPPRPAAPVSIAPHVGAAHRLTDLEDPRYRPRLPPSINRPGMTVWGVFRICVGADGHVLDVTVVKSADALVDNDWIAKIKTWQYRPYSVDGRPVPFCHPARIFVKAAN